jgi:hypothetical protein
LLGGFFFRHFINLHFFPFLSTPFPEFLRIWFKAKNLVVFVHHSKLVVS